ncbi:MAG: cytochrome C peroxidase, partial [Chryseobacterium sp.]
NLFMGKAQCATCHFLPLFNGTVPPNFKKTEQEVLGVAENAFNKKIDSDAGRGKFHQTIAFLQNSFKTPTLRNVSKTAPYMHNGGYKTLQEVMQFYNQGGGKGFNLKVENQTLSDKKLNLTSIEIDEIIEFLNALNDK